MLRLAFFFGENRKETSLVKVNITDGRRQGYVNCGDVRLQYSTGSHVSSGFASLFFLSFSFLKIRKVEFE